MEGLYVLNILYNYFSLFGSILFRIRARCLSFINKNTLPQSLFYFSSLQIFHRHIIIIEIEEKNSNSSQLYLSYISTYTCEEDILNSHLGLQLRLTKLHPYVSQLCSVRTSNSAHPKLSLLCSSENLLVLTQAPTRETGIMGPLPILPPTEVSDQVLTFYLLKCLLHDHWLPP